MAKRITGSDWANEVIEGLDGELSKRFSSALENANRKSFLSIRSGLETVQKLKDREILARKKINPTKVTEEEAPRTDPSSFEHLAPSAFAQYERFETLTRKNFLARAEKLPDAPRPKIVVLDLAWGIDDEVMPDKTTFLTADCEEINTVRCTTWGGENEEDELNPLLQVEPVYIYNPKKKRRERREGRRIHHGASCVGALRISKKKTEHRKLIWGSRRNPSDQEAMYWNLSSRADIILLPLRSHAEIEPKAYQNALSTALDTDLISEEEYQAFLDEDTLHRVNKASRSDRGKNIPAFHDLLKDDILSSKKPSSNDGKVAYTSPVHLLIVESTIRAVRKNPQKDVLVVGKEISESVIGRLFASIQWAIEEAGFVATLKLLRDAAQIADGGTESLPKIGRGDTLVVPLEVQIWNSKGKKVRDAINHENSSLTAKDFLRDRPEQPNEEDLRPCLSKIERIELPIIAYPAVENEVRTLTCECKLSVVVSAGNSHLDLGQICIEKLDRFLPTKRCETQGAESLSDAIPPERQKLFESRGTYCGAIIVGSGVVNLAGYWMDPLSRRFTEESGKSILNVKKHETRLRTSLIEANDPKDQRWDFANYGLCIDASGRGSATEIFGMKTNPVIDLKFYYHWSGASIASMVTAACIANIQHIRLLSDYAQYVRFLDGKRKKPAMLLPLKPFEARAHINQWRANDAFQYECLADLMGAPPDIKGWFMGSCYYHILQQYAQEGARIINERYDIETASTDKT